MGEMATFAVLGLGEAGGEISADLAASGQQVFGFDVVEVQRPEGVTLVDDPTRAAEGADVMVALVPAADAMVAAESVLSALSPHKLYADFCSGAPRLKRELAALVESTGAVFADVTLMGTVSGRGLKTPALTSGLGAPPAAKVLGSLGMPIEVVSDVPGDAATRKLLRSVFVKGMTGAATEALEAARGAGCEDWLWDNIAGELQRADESLLKRLVDGTYKHALRRADEMAAAEQLVESVGTNALVTRAVRQRLQTVASEARET